MKTYGHYQEYLERRWTEMGVPAVSADILARYGHPKQIDINAWLREGDPRGQRIWDELLHVHATAFHRILGELYWTHANNDVGAGRKPDGHNWRGLAEDIVVLRPIDQHGNVVADHPVQLVDAVYAMGGVDAKIVWDVIAPNPSRTWVKPERPGSAPKPEPKPDPAPVPPTPPIPPPPVPPPPPGIDYATGMLLMRDELSDVYGMAPGWEETFSGLAAVIFHWSYQLLHERQSVESVREDYRARKGE